MVTSGAADATVQTGSVSLLDFDNWAFAISTRMYWSPPEVQNELTRPIFRRSTSGQPAQFHRTEFEPNWADHNQYGTLSRANQRGQFQLLHVTAGSDSPHLV